MAARRAVPRGQASHVLVQVAGADPPGAEDVDHFEVARKDEATHGTHGYTEPRGDLLIVEQHEVRVGQNGRAIHFWPPLATAGQQPRRFQAGRPPAAVRRGTATVIPKDRRDVAQHHAGRKRGQVDPFDGGGGTGPSSTGATTRARTRSPT